MKNLLNILTLTVGILIITQQAYSSSYNLQSSNYQTLNYKLQTTNYLLIVDSIEIRKQLVNDFYSVVSSNAYIPINLIDKNLIDNLKTFKNVMNTCRQLEKEMEEEKSKSFIIFDAPVIEKNSREQNLPIG